MQMKFSKTKQGEAANNCKLRGRTGHRAIGANGSIFVVGGRSEEGLWKPEVQRINCETRRIDSLILDNTLCLQDFALFWFQESLFVWGGYTLEQYSNQLLQFDGLKFTAVRQTGEIPKARASHCYSTFGGKYLIIYGGHSHQQFFNDWYLLNMKKQEWSRLNPSLFLNFSSGGKMVWSNGRGFLLLNEIFDEQLNFYQPNLFFQFHITNFQQKKLKILPLQLKITLPNPSLIFTHMIPYKQQFFLIFGGYQMGKLSNTHDSCYMIDFENETVQPIDLGFNGVGFQALFAKQTLYILGGSEKIGNLSGMCCLKWGEPKKQTRRNVCWMCNLYFDQQWVIKSSQAYERYRVKEEVDFNYSMKIDNNVLKKLSSYITHQFFALTLILQTIRQLNPMQIFINLFNVQQPYSNDQIGQKRLQYLRLLFEIPQQLISPLISQLKMQKNVNKKYLEGCQSLTLLMLQLKLAAFRMAKSTLMVFKMDEETVYVAYFSSCQLQCTTSNFSTFSNYSYTFKAKQNYCSSQINRHIIHQNMKHVFKNPEQFQDIDTNFAIFSICGNYYEAQILLQSEHNNDLQTWDSNVVSSMKDETKRSVPLIQLSFLPSYCLPRIIIEENNLKIFNLYQMLQNDLGSNLLKPVQIQKSGFNNKTEIFQRICLCHYPEQYLFKKVLVYHKGRLINRLNFASQQICGIIQLNSKVSLDLGRSNLQHPSDRQAFQRILDCIKTSKRIYSS